MDKIWWNHITKAHKFLNDIVTAAIEGKSVILSLPSNVPWHDTLIELMEEQLKLENPKNSFDKISCPKEEVGLYLLNKYCKREKRATYRYGMTYAAFLGKSEDIVLNDRYIWVSDIPKSKYDEWIDFIVEYNKNVSIKTPAVFILETCDENFVHKAKKGIKKILFEQNIDAYDKFAFCTLIATENNCKEYMRPYLAELVSAICKEDIELCAECMAAGDRFLKKPTKVLQFIVENNHRSNGEKYQFSKNKEQIKTLLWETQLKYVFPLIEKYRNYFISRYTTSIEKVLPFENSYGESIQNPEEVEIGTLLYMVKSGAIVVSDKELKELECYRDARNKLAHLNILKLDIVEQIIKRGNALNRE